MPRTILHIEVQLKQRENAAHLNTDMVDMLHIFVEANQDTKPLVDSQRARSMAAYAIFNA